MATSLATKHSTLMTVTILLGFIMADTNQIFALDAPDITAEITMRDGLDLPVKVHLPKGEGPWPVVLCRWYDATAPGFHKPQTFLDSGYAFATGAIRDGAFGDVRGEPGVRFTRDDVDGYDTVEWIAKQSWCNGQVAMTGKSAGGITAWQAATANPPHLKAIIPQNYGGSFGTWGVWGYRANGAVTLAMTLNGRAVPAINKEPWLNDRNAYMHLPLIDFDEYATGSKNQLWRNYVSEETWTEDHSYKKINIPVMLTVGWWDYYAGSALELWLALKNHSDSPDVRIVVDATQHTSRFPSDGKDYAGGQADIAELSIQWLDYVLKGEQNGIDKQQPVKVFTMTANKWQDYDNWPPSQAVMTKLYLRNKEQDRFGTLDRTPPDDEPATNYTYDPDNPALSLGGNHSIWYHHPLAPVGSFDHSANEKRTDVLVFTTDPLTSDTEVTGTPQVNFYAATDVKDTDFIAILLDVGPDGKPQNVTMGIIRARYRNGIYKPAELLTPGKIENYELNLMPTSYVFRKGHRIRLHISSSNFPLWDRNPNTGGNIATETKTQEAHQKILHNKAHQSHLMLPILTGDINTNSNP